MARLVMKFGGTSVANVERIRNVARHVKREIEAGHEAAVVVSAMAGKTNELVAWCKEAGSLFDDAEYDAVVASGELVTSGLLALEDAAAYNEASPPGQRREPRAGGLSLRAERPPPEWSPSGAP